MGDERNGTEDQMEEEGISRLLLGMMEGYSDSVIPPLSQFSHLHETAIAAKASSSRKRGRPPANEFKTEGTHKERDRREKMTEMYSVLQTMVPNLFPKATKEKVVSETIEYIESLEKERKRLEELKRSSQTTGAKGEISQSVNWNPSVSVDVCGHVAFFAIQSPVRRSLMMQIFQVFEKHRTEVLQANIAVNGKLLTLTVTAFVKGDREDTIRKIRGDILIL